MCMLKRCMAPRLKTTAEEEQAATVHQVETLSEQRAFNIFHRVEFLRKIREKLTPTPSSISALKERLRSKCKPDPELPEWWVCGRHDAELIVIAKRYGLAHLDYAMMCDTTVSYLNTLKEHLKSAALLNKSSHNRHQVREIKDVKDTSTRDQQRDVKKDNAPETIEKAKTDKAEKAEKDKDNTKNDKVELMDTSESPEISRDNKTNKTSVEKTEKGAHAFEADERDEKQPGEMEVDQDDIKGQGETDKLTANGEQQTRAQREESPKSDSTEPLDESVCDTFLDQWYVADVSHILFNLLGKVNKINSFIAILNIHFARV